MNAPEDRRSWIAGEDAELPPGAAIMEAYGGRIGLGLMVIVATLIGAWLGVGHS